jgi:hypothetical protein
MRRAECLREIGRCAEQHASREHQDQLLWCEQVEVFNKSMYISEKRKEFTPTALACRPPIILRRRGWYRQSRIWWRTTGRTVLEGHIREDEN